MNDPGFQSSVWLAFELKLRLAWTTMCPASMNYWLLPAPCAHRGGTVMDGTALFTHWKAAMPWLVDDLSSYPDEHWGELPLAHWGHRGWVMMGAPPGSPPCP